MKVLQVVQSYYPAVVYGGPIFSIHYSSEALARRGIDVDVATTNANGDGRLDVSTETPQPFGPHYRVRYYNDTIISRFSWDFTRNLGREIRGADVVHLQDVFSTYAAWAIFQAWRQTKPLLISPRGSLTAWGLESKRPWLKKLWLASLVRPWVAASARVAWHATSEAERSEVLALFPAATVHVIPNGIDCATFDRVNQPARSSYFKRFFPERSDSPETTRALVALGRLHKKKCLDIAIEALARLRNAGADCVLLIAGGDDGELPHLQRMIAELGLEASAKLVGELKGDDKIAFLKGADVFLFPSHSENFGMVALEALAAGTPVVASRNTPWASLETQGSGAWVENAPDALAQGAMELLGRDAALLGQAARQHANQFDLNTVAASFERVYRQMIDTAEEVEAVEAVDVAASVKRP